MKLIVMLAAALTMFVLPAQAQVTSSIPLSTIGSAPPTRSGTLPNGVGWSVNVGSWLPPQGYAAYPVGNATQPGPQCPAPRRLCRRCSSSVS